MNNKNIHIIFYSINPLNYLIALFLSFFFCVFYWRKSCISEYLLFNFKQIYHYGSFSMQDWATMIAPILNKIRSKIRKNTLTKNLIFKLDNTETNLMPAIIHSVALDYEKVFQFFKLVNLHQKHTTTSKILIVNFNVYKKLINLNLIEKEETLSLILSFNCYLDLLYSKLYSFLILLRTYTYFLKNVFIFKKISKIKISFYKFSDLEVGSTDKERSLKSLIIDKEIKKSESLFLLYGKISKNKRLNLKKNNIKFLMINDTFKYVSKINQIKILLWITKIFFLNKSKSSSILKSYVIDQLVRDVLILAFIKQNKIKMFVNSSYSGVNETPIISFLRSSGIKTVYWYYYNMGYKYFNKEIENKYCFELVEDCISLSEYKYVWSDNDLDILKKRSLNNLFSNKVTYKTIGPLMLGNNKFNKLSPQIARQKYNFKGKKSCKIWISIFDLPTFKPYAHTEHRWLIGQHDETSVNIFFNTILELLDKFPNIGFIYKPKRPMHINDLAWFKTSGQEKLCDPTNEFVKNKQLIILEDNVNPYIPITICDHAIGMSFTSAVTAANFFNRESIYLDLNRKDDSSIYPYSLNHSIISDRIKLFSKVEYWTKQNFKPFYKDPIENFNLSLNNLILK